jgi:Ulp1 family protease
MYFCDTFFYKKIKEPGDIINSWVTTKVNIFSHDYIIVPVNITQSHWYLVVICNLAKLDPSRKEQEKKSSGLNRCSVSSASARPATDIRKAVLPSEPDATAPMIVVFDSLPQDRPTTYSVRRNYIVQHAKATKNWQIDSGSILTMKAEGLPFQKNNFDCGLHLCANAERFIHDPSGALANVLLRESNMHIRAAKVLWQQMLQVIAWAQSEGAGQTMPWVPKLGVILSTLSRQEEQ